MLLRGTRPITATDSRRRDLARELVADLRHLDRRLHANQAQIQQVLGETHSTITEIRGVGHIIAGKILGHVGDITRPDAHSNDAAADMAKMKHNAIVANVGRFDTEIDMAGLAKVPGIERIEVKPQVHEWRFPDGHSILVLSEGRLMNLGNATGHPSFVMSTSFTNQTMAQVELFTRPGSYTNQVYLLPKDLDEKVARLHLDALGVRLTKLTKKQADDIGVDLDGPYKPAHN